MNDELLKVLDYYHFEVNGNEKIICPFHGDVNPSLKIDLESNFWYCFGCQQGGDAYTFHKKIQYMKGQKNELKVLQKYHKIINKKLVNKSSELKTSVEKDRKYYRQCLIKAKDYYYNLSKVNWKTTDCEVREYMLYRGFNLTTLNKFGAKLTHKEETYPIIFPIMDNGRFKGWVCRTTDFEINKKRKYLYNKGFRRKVTLAGEYKNTDTVILVEGYFDMLKAYQLGLKNVVAILGWKITDQQIKKLKAEGVVNIISALDNDTCGRKGTAYLKKFFNVIKFPYPDNVKDMGDMDRNLLKAISNKTHICGGTQWE